MFVKLVHDSNAELPIPVTESGIAMFVKLVHDWKAELPM
jgi:hypothetical protein